MILINYFLYYVLLIPISLLPMRVLYWISDFGFVLLYHVFPYRKKIVLQNLRNSFPEKSEEEIELISKKFYSYFCDLVIEVIKGFTISEKEILSRVIISNREMLNKYVEENVNLIFITSHYCNWEWASLALHKYSKHKGFAIYAPLKNKFWDVKMKNMRQKFGVEFLPMSDVLKYFKANRNVLSSYVFIADQTPVNVDKCYWTNFLHQDTPWFLGPEKFAQLFKYPVLYGEIRLIKRGYYEITSTVITEDLSKSTEGEITEMHIRKLERIIEKQPEFWLWTHRRWKRKRPQS